MHAKATACANIALVKYWGKRDAALNLPAAPSVSLTLEALTTTAEVTFVSDGADFLAINGEPASAAATARVSRWLDLVRARAGIDHRAHIATTANFPVASGLASSASAFAALAVASARAAGLDLEDGELSALARRGSGSAARSIFGGVVKMDAGERKDGTDAIATQVIDREAARAWGLRMVIAVVGGGATKAIGSTEAMERTRDTSPYYEAFTRAAGADTEAMVAAIHARDLHAVGRIAEASALAMHASAMAARPGILYFQPPTVALIARVRTLREAGISAYFTIDAGPHVKVLTTAADAAEVAAAMAAIDGVSAVMVSEPGGPARILE